MKKIFFEPSSIIKYDGPAPFLGMAFDLCNLSYSVPACSIRVCAISDCRIWVHKKDTPPLGDGMYLPCGESFELITDTPGVLTVRGTINIAPTKNTQQL